MRSIFFNLLLTVTLFVADASIVSAQKTDAPYLKFQSLNDLPTVLEWPATVTDGRYVYVVNPYTSARITTAVIRFDPKTAKWAVASTAASKKIQAAAAWSPTDSHIYVFGGTVNGGWKIFAGVESINTNTGEIKDLGIINPMPTVYGCAAAWDKLIYVFGGTQNADHTIASMYSFDPQNKQFTRLADMPESVQTAGAIVNGVLYTFGGFDQFLNTQSKNINAYDIKTNTWKTVATLPRGISSNAVAVCGDLIFVVGDYNEETFLGYYNTSNNTFVKLNSNMTGHRAGGAAVINNILYVFGGKTNYKTTLGGIKTVQAADISGLLDK